MLTPYDIMAMVGKSDPVILDVGCNDGEHTQMFRQVFPCAHIYSFEPDKRAQHRFRQRNPGEQLLPVAVGASDGEAPFYQSHGDGVTQVSEWDYSGSIRQPKNHLVVHPWCGFDDPTMVVQTTLDTWRRTANVDVVDFIWADVQGAEGDLVKGAEETLRRTRFFYTEYNDSEMYIGQVTLAQLRGLLPDFEVVHVYSDDVLFRNVRLT